MGPACESIEVLKEMMKAGMNVARLNKAHGERIATIRQAAAETGSNISILMDIKGPEIRIGKLKEASYELKAGQALTFVTEEQLGDGEKLWVNYADMPKVMEPGGVILLDDGLIELRVNSVDDKNVYCTVVNGGVIKPRKGVNLPGVRTTLPGVTERDVMHIDFGIKENVDIVATLSKFVVCLKRQALAIFKSCRKLKTKRASRTSTPSSKHPMVSWLRAVTLA
jgi:pyruvate kinase